MKSKSMSEQTAKEASLVTKVTDRTGKADTSYKMC